MRRLVAVAFLVALTLASCSDAGIEFSANLGGDTTRTDASRNSFGLPAPTLSNDERLLFEIGDSFFTKNWVTAPASTDARDGLGPTFNAQACSSCHVLDGRGLVPESSTDDSARGLLYRLSVPGAAPDEGPYPDPVYGGQLQDRAVLGVEPEGTMAVTYEEVPGEYGDGSPFSLRAPTYEIANLAYGPLDQHAMIGPRLAPQVIGMGLLEAIAEADIVAAADPDDADGDGISGRPNRVVDDLTGELVLGRFGWKANVATVEQQAAGAFSGDIGITSAIHPDENCSAAQTECATSPDGGSPELTPDRLDAVTFYTKTLSVPAMRDSEDGLVKAGAGQFESMGCTSCHTPEHQTGDSDIPALSNQNIVAFTDLLLHDMGPGLADDRPDFLATGTEWRTPPLWGIGLIEAVNGDRFLLHDGRARTMAEAVLWHDGEALASRENFRTAAVADRDALIAFLEAL